MDWEEQRQKLLNEQAELRGQRQQTARAMREFNRVKEKIAPDDRIERGVELEYRLTQIDQRIEDIDLELL
ncbi:hypothetical protein HG15A2_37500 [Adhaeretor mobilis]|uniref:Uncharacterized protein n=2 Tax=Adhaeretor mobilis TaxID=1930276 RepID=A0A517MZY1_9BACT|nr:hypothetical protein HG15A2_37500 [Adhaeretor mobilis]